jgi:hypothetical protein
VGDEAWDRPLRRRREAAERPAGRPRSTIRAAGAGGEGDQLPVVGELDADLLAAISGGQAVVFTSGEQPAAVVIDLDTYAECRGVGNRTPR